MSFRINRGVWQFKKADGTYESKYKLSSDGRLVTTDALGNEISTFGGNASWDTLTGKPSTFTPSAHGHAISEVTGLQSALDGKQAAGSYAAASHTHTIANVTGLQSALDGKQAAGSYLTSLGFSYSTGVTANHVVQRDANGYIYANHINFSTTETENPTINSFFVSNGDGWSRKASVAHVKSQLGLGSAAYTASTAYAAASHTHTIANVTGLQAALDGKQAAGSYAAASHTHDDRYYTESEVNTLLAGKQAAGSYLTTSGKAADSELIDGIDSSRIIYGDGGFGSTSYSDMNNTAQKSGFFFYNNPTGSPFGDWTHWINSMGNSWNPNYGFQLAHAFHSDRLAVRVVANGGWGSWRTIIDSGNIGSQSVSYAATAGSAPANGGNSNTVGGLAVHGNRNSEANKVVRTDGNGYIQAGWINTTSGDNGTTAISRIYASQDGYIRYYTPANFISVLGLITTSSIGSQSVNYAASAGTADNIDGVGFRNTGSNAAVNADTLESNGITYYTSGVTNFSGNATDGALYSQVYSSSWQHQIAGDYRSGQIALRGKNNGTWQAWRTVLDSSNFSSWAQPRGDYAASSHTHTIANVTGLQAALDGKQAAGSYAASSHTHTPSQVGLGNVSNAAQVTTTYNTSLNSDSRNSRGVTRLYRRDSDSDFSLQTYWTGSYWKLDGYNGDTFHANVQVGYANSSGEASYATESGFALNSNYANSSGSASSASTATNIDNGNTYTTGNNLYIKNSGVNNYRIHHNGGDGVFDVLNKYSVRHMTTIWSAQRVVWGDWMSYMWFDVDPWSDNWGIGGNPTSWKTVNRGSFLTFGFEDWSDRRHKSAIVEIENAVDKVKAISGYTYWKRGSEVREAGVIAQDVLAVLPEATGGTEDGYSVKPAALIGLLMKAVKEQQEMIDSLTARIVALENK